MGRMRWRWRPSTAGAAYADRRYTCPAELFDWVREGVEMPGNPADDFQTDGVRVHLLDAPPGRAPASSLELSAVDDNGLKGAVFAVVAVLGLLLLPARLPLRALVVGAVIVALVLCGALLPLFAAQVLNGVFLAAIFVVAVIWTVAFLATRKRPVGRRPVARRARGRGVDLSQYQPEPPLAEPPAAEPPPGAQAGRRAAPAERGRAERRRAEPCVGSRRCEITNCKFQTAQNANACPPRRRPRSAERGDGPPRAAARHAPAAPPPVPKLPRARHFAFCSLHSALLHSSCRSPCVALVRRRESGVGGRRPVRRAKGPRNLRPLHRPAHPVGKPAEAGDAGAPGIQRPGETGPAVTPSPTCPAAGLAWPRPTMRSPPSRSGPDQRPAFHRTCWRTVCTPLPLDLVGVGIQTAKLDDRDAPIGRDAAGRLVLFVEGAGEHRLALEMVAPLETTAARQVLNFRLPRPAADSLRLTVPGDVEFGSGADVISRTVDQAAGRRASNSCRAAGDTSLVMTLNSHLQRHDRVVVARSVLPGRGGRGRREVSTPP